MDKNKTIEDRKGTPLLNMIRDIGGWSISNKTGYWNEKKWSLQTALEKTKIYGVLFSFFIGEDDKNSSRNILQVCISIYCHSSRYDTLLISFLVVHEDICCGYSLEAPQ